MVLEWMQNYANGQTQKKASEWLTNNASTVHSAGQSLKRIANVIKSFEDYQYPEANPSENSENDASDATKSSKRGTPNFPNTLATGAQAIYEQSLEGFRARLDETWHDNLVSVKRLQEALSEARGCKLKDYENVYWHAVVLSSVNAAEQSELLNNYIQPLMDDVRDIVKKYKMTQDDIEVYLNCKHGLERNERMARKETDQVAKRNQKLIDKATEALNAGQMTQEDYNDYVMCKHPKNIRRRTESTIVLSVRLALICYLHKS